MMSEKKPGFPGISGLIDRIRDSQPQRDAPPEPVERLEKEQKTFLVVGLGNPGKEYASNRHNIGFMFVDRLAERLDVRFARMQARALIADTRYRGHRLILVKPQTYMNESGQSVSSLQKFFKIPLGQVIVAFDDMDLPLGKIRIRPKGGSSGQNGMKSIIRRFSNNQNFPRIRLGIGRPPGRMPPPAYLLQDFSKDELTVVKGLLEEAVEAALTFVTEGIDMAMNRFNTGTVDDD